MKKIITNTIFALLASAALFAGGKKEENTSGVTVVPVGTEGAYPPYNFVEKDGTVNGYDIDVMRAIDERIPEITFKYEPTAWDGIFVALESGKFDIIASELGKNKDREAKYLFAEKPYLYSYNVIVYKKGRTDIKSIADLHGKTVAGGVGSFNTTWLEEYNKVNGDPIKIAYYDGNAALFFNDIANGRVDATLADPVTTDLFAKEQGLPLEYVINGEREAAPIYLLFARTENGRKYKAQIDKALDEIIADGTLKQISIKWFGKDWSVKPTEK